MELVYYCLFWVVLIIIGGIKGLCEPSIPQGLCECELCEPKDVERWWN